MAQEIYNEGRVIGLSAWEIFAKALRSKNVPDTDIPSESQWLTSMIGSGMSIILKIPSGTAAGIYDFDLPEGNVLAASGVVLANPFTGECNFVTSQGSGYTYGWADKVIDYGGLISNNSTASPDSYNVPSQSTATDYSQMVREFTKITDGIVYLASANWQEITNKPPQKDINPNYNESHAVIRLNISEALGRDIHIIFTGFQNKRILQAFAGYSESGEGGSTDTSANDWQNGGMLGPESTPWATKILFSVPNLAYNSQNTITRTFPNGATVDSKTVGVSGKQVAFKNMKNEEVKTNSLIDFNSINLTDYFNAHRSEYSSADYAATVLEENVSGLQIGTAEGFSTLTAWYPGMTTARVDAATDISQIFPPALYATQYNSTGTKSMVPLDIAAPGTVKAFDNSTDAYNYTVQMPKNYSLYHNTTTDTYSFVKKGVNTPSQWTGTAIVEYLSAPRAKITAGNTSAEFIALTNSSGTAYTTTGKTGQNYNTAISVGPTKDLVWDDLLSALVNNQPVDVLGDWLHTIGKELTSTTTSGGGIRHALGLTDNYHIDYVASKWLLLNPGDSSATDWTTDTSLWLTSEYVEEATGFNTRYLKLDYSTTPASIHLGTNFIKFANGLKLFIATSAPSTTGVEPGSIGIGW